MNITPRDAVQFILEAAFSLLLYRCFYSVTFTYIPWLVTCFQCAPAQTFVNKLDHCWRLPQQLDAFSCLFYLKEMFSIRLSEAKENRTTKNWNKEINGGRRLMEIKVQETCLRYIVIY